MLYGRLVTHQCMSLTIFHDQRVSSQSFYAKGSCLAHAAISWKPSNCRCVLCHLPQAQRKTPKAHKILLRKNEREKETYSERERESEKNKLKLTSCLNSHTDRYGSAISAIASRTFARIFTKVGSKTVAFCTSSSSVGTTISFQQLACQILIDIASWHSTIFCPEF